MEISNGCKFITLQTKSIHTYEPRNVTLVYSDYDKDITLLGNLPHGTRIILSQELINDLQAILNEMED